MSILVLGIIAAVVSVVLPNYPDLAGDPAPAWTTLLLAIGVWQSLDGLKRLIQERQVPHFEFICAIAAFLLVALLSIWQDDAIYRPIWVVVACSVVISSVIGFFKWVVRHKTP